MALRPIYCAECGLEIYPDQELIPYKGDGYHGFPYACYPFRDEKEE